MIKALFFDLFGTVVDWRGSIIEQLKKSKLSKGNWIKKSSYSKSGLPTIMKKIVEVAL